MTRTQFRLQSAFVLVLIGLVSWPEYRPVRAMPTMWRVNSPLAPSRDLTADTRLAMTPTATPWGVVGYGTEGTPASADAALPPQLQAMVTNVRDEQATQRLDDPTQAAIIGRARTLLNTPVPYAKVFLRNIRTGQIEAEATADKEGRFSFLNLKYAAYIVEMVGRDGRVIGTSQPVATQGGQAQTATIRVASSLAVQAMFSPVVNPTAQDALRAAAQNNVPTVTQQSTSLSPRQ